MRAKIILLAFAILISLCLAEAGLSVYLGIAKTKLSTEMHTVRWLKYPKKPDPELGTINQPEFHSQFVDHNSLGMRNREEFSPMPPPGVRRALLLGDSYCYGSEIRQEDIFSELLSREMPGYEFVNSGSIGYNTVQEFLILKRFAPMLHPDAAILFYCQNNDMFANSRPVNPPPAPYAKITGTNLVYMPYPPKPRDTHWFEQFNLYKLFDRRILKGKDFTYLAQRMEFQAFKGRSYQWRVTRAILHDLSAYCRQEHIALAVIDVPAVPVSRIKASPLRQELLKEACAEEGIPYYNLADYYPADDSSAIIPGDGHWNEKGHRIVAELIKSIMPRLEKHDGKR